MAAGHYLADYFAAVSVFPAHNWTVLNVNLTTTIWIYAGGEGSGCHGPNCGRPATSAASLPFRDGWITKDGQYHRLHGTHAETAVSLGLAEKEEGAVGEALQGGNVRIIFSGPGWPAMIEVHKLDDATRERVASVIERMGFPPKVYLDVNAPRQAAEFNGQQVYTWMKTGSIPRKSKVAEYHTVDAAGRKLLRRLRELASVN